MKDSVPQCYLGIDMGGTAIKALCLQGDGKILVRKQVPTQSHEGSEAVIRRLIRLIGDVVGDLKDKRKVVGVGIAVAGVVDKESGTVLLLPNFPGLWQGIPLGPRLQDHFKVPSFVINDARAATLGEKTFGAGQQSNNMVMLTLGTGVGGGIIIDGELYFGSEGHAGEVGHQTIDPDGPLCGCGNQGCLEALASGPAIASMGVRAVKQGMTTSIRDLAGGDLDNISPKTIADAASDGDAVANWIIRTAGSYIGIGIANLVVILNPDTVVVGGGVAKAGDLLFRAIEETVDQRVCIFAGGRGTVRIVPAALGEEAGAIGAAVWAMKKVQRTPAAVEQ